MRKSRNSTEKCKGINANEGHEGHIYRTLLVMEVVLKDDETDLQVARRPYSRSKEVIDCKA